MKIRSITYFDTLRWPLDDVQIQNAGEFVKNARGAYQDQGFEVQTTRLASAPFPYILQAKVANESVAFAVALEAQMLRSGFDYASIGPAIPSVKESYKVIPKVLANTQYIFTAGIISSAEIGIDPGAIKQCAWVITENSVISADGFGNLRFAALANVPSGSPFLPAAYHEFGRKPGFAIATESADLAVTAFGNVASLDTARSGLIKSIEKSAQELELIGQKLALDYGVQFEGIDFSFAPFPTAEQSIGTAVEKLGVPGVGNHGSLAAIAILAAALDQAQFQKVGFNGVMLPVLEDTVLAGSATADMLTVNNLLLYSAVCGTGLDTVPLPGSVSEDQLYAVLLDLAALAQRLGKPLTARLMPIPGKKAGDTTEFDFEFFANSKIMGLDAQPLFGNLAENNEIPIKNRNSSSSARGLV
jgi:uncharacterized protein (UPF0210 family)